MHERSLVESLIRQIDEEVQRRGLGRLHGVHLEIGEFAGVESVLFESAFAELAADHWPGAVELTCRSISLTARCRRCLAEFVVERFRFVCPHCQGRELDVIAGEELKLVSLRAEAAPCEVAP